MSKNSQSPVGVVAKANQATSRDLAAQVISWLTERKRPYRVDSAIAAELSPKLDNAVILDRKEFTKTCDPIVILGGDGTLISVCRHPAPHPPRIIGVNLGTLGFLTEITTEELFSTLERTLEGNAELETRSLLSAVVVEDKKEIARFSAINDIVVTKEALARIFAINLSVDNGPEATIRGDGLIVATPGGSTAYSLAAGGAIVHPGVDAILVTPICPHSLTSRPLVLPGKSEVTLQVSPNAKAENGEVFLTIDGQEGMALSPGHQVAVKTSPHAVSFVKSESRRYFDVLATKLQWAKT